jgi:hypothetical protein
MWFIDVGYCEIEINKDRYIISSYLEEIVQKHFKLQLKYLLGYYYLIFSTWTVFSKLKVPSSQG